jgi:hypothetical protein
MHVMSPSLPLPGLDELHAAIEASAKQIARDLPREVSFVFLFMMGLS